jgi:hypothetical protein
MGQLAVSSVPSHSASPQHVCALAEARHQRSGGVQRASSQSTLGVAGKWGARPQQKPSMGEPAQSAGQLMHDSPSPTLQARLRARVAQVI